MCFPGPTARSDVQLTRVGGWAGDNIKTYVAVSEPGQPNFQQTNRLIAGSSVCNIQSRELNKLSQRLETSVEAGLCGLCLLHKQHVGTKVLNVVLPGAGVQSGPCNQSPVGEGLLRCVRRSYPRRR